MVGDIATSIRRARDVGLRLAPLLGVVAATVAVYLGTDALVTRWPGPPGFDVVTTVRGQTTATRARWLLAPEVIGALPVDGDRAARAVFLAHRSGRYTFNFGATHRGRLLLDGKEVVAAKDQRAHDGAVDLARGLHALAVELQKGDAEGAVMLAMRPPGAKWGARLVGPGDVVAAPIDAVARRLGRRPRAALAVMPYLPAAATAIALLVALVAAGRARRRRAREYLTSLSDEGSNRNPERVPNLPRCCDSAEPSRTNAMMRSLATVAALLILAAPVLRPLFAPGYYECHEEESFIVRLDQFAAATSGGVPMGRWFPDPVFGRGYPFLCLYAPLLYLLAWPLLAVGASALATMKILSAGMILGAGGATYGLVRRRASRPAALLAATLVLYAPYFHYDLYVRGALAETLGFATFPFALWALDAALDRRAPEAPRAYFEVAWLALALGLLGSSHNITGYFATWFLAAWVLVRLALRDAGWDGLVRVAAGAGLGFLLTVFYALPAVFDKQRVWIELITVGFYHYGHHFNPLKQILWGPKSYDITLGIPTTLALALGVAAAVRARFRGWRSSRNPERVPNLPRRSASAEPSRSNAIRNTPHAALTVVAFAGTWLAAALITPQPIGEWFFHTVPLAKFVEFPWRIFLFAGCLGALAAAGAVDGWLPAGRARAWGVGAAVAAIALTSLSWIGPPSPLLRRHNHEVEMLQSLPVDYVTSMNEYLPGTVSRQTGPFGLVARALDPATALKDGVRVPGRYQVTAIARAPAVVEFNAHWFPGWRATVDGREAAIGPGAPSFDTDGLIRVAVPPGQHAVAIRYGRTPLRLACDLVSLGALLVVMGLFGLALRQRSSKA
jgi:hypothetical protein